MSILTLDDRDPSFSYAGPWAKMAADSDYDGTSTWTNLTVSTVNISFTGVQITVFGTIAPIGTGDAPTTYYTVDNSSTKQPFTATQQANAQYHQQFFQSNTLPLGNHTLLIEYLTITGEFILDYAQIALTVPTVSPISLPSTSSTLSTISPSSTAVPAVASSKHHSTTTYIAVGVIGGLLVISFIIHGVILRQRRKSRLEKKLPVSAGDVTPFHPQPLQTADLTMSPSFVSAETKSAAHMQVPPPAYEAPQSLSTYDPM